MELFEKNAANSTWKLKMTPYQQAVSKNFVSFYYDCDKFIESNRFKRFVEIVKRNITEMLVENNISTHNDNYSYDNANPDYMTVLGKVIYEITVDRENSEDKSLETDINTNNWIFYQGTIYKGMFKCVPLRQFANLWNVENMLKFLYEGAEDEPPKFAALAVGAITRSPEFQGIYNDAITRACYDFIRNQSLIEGLCDENWYNRLKKLTPEQTLSIAIRTYEYVLTDTEEFACSSMISSTDKELGLEFRKFLDACKSTANKNDKTNTLEQKNEQLSNIIETQKDEIQKLKAENASLQQTINGINASVEENRRLKKDVKAKDEKIESLTEKYNSLQEYVELLQSANNEVISDDADFQVDESVKNKRIVFIRAKDAENYNIFSKLAECYPNARFTDTLSGSINAAATDMVVLMVSSLPHRITYRAEGIAKGSNIKYIKCAYSNVNMVIKCVNAALTKGE
ncbi:MAG: hypothetical protein IJK26_09215 [Clostridia bacterium]|nr:hypothetical protein [Clostridia bacterium]